MLFQWDSCIEFLNESAPLTSEKLFLGDSGIEFVNRLPLTSEKLFRGESEIGFVNGLTLASEKLFRGESEFLNDCPLTRLAFAALGALCLQIDQARIVRVAIAHLDNYCFLKPNYRC